MTPDETQQGFAALDALKEVDDDATAALEAWLQTGVPPCAEGAALRLVRFQLEAAANVASALGAAGIPVPPAWTQRDALSWLLVELWWSSMRPLLDNVWLECHGRSEE